MKDGLNVKTRRPLDILVAVLCLLGTAASLYLFQRDLLQTVNSHNTEKAGTVAIRHNIVQRRQADRLLWDRLHTESLIYPGDLIRVAESSDAVLRIGSNDIDLSENTLIQIQIDKVPRIELFSGKIKLTTGTDEWDTVVVVNGSEVRAGPGSAFNVAVGDGGMTLQVDEGNVVFAGEGQNSSIAAGTMIALNAQGGGQMNPAVTMTNPPPNARYLNSRQEPLGINFAWNRINLEEGEPLELKIAEDRKFTRITQEFAANNAAQAALDTGVWYWKLLYKDAVLSDGRVMVVNAPAPSLFSPAMNHVYQYQNKYPELRFRWTEVAEASHYLLQAGETPDFNDPQINISVQDTLFINSSLGQGTWYWRVQPVFPAGYEGSASFSETASFRIRQSDGQGGQNSVPNPPILQFPPSNGTVDITTSKGNVYLSWEVSKEAVSSTVQIAADQSLSNPFVNQTVQDNFFVYGKDGQNIEPGQYFWNVYFTNHEGKASPPSPTQSFTAGEGKMPPTPTPQPISAPDPTDNAPPPAEPAAAVSKPVVQEVKPPPQPTAPEKPSPPPKPLPSPLLPEPPNRQPPEGYRFGEQELRTLKTITFNWSPVPGANAYIFSLFHETNSGRKQIIHIDPPITQTEWTLRDFNVLDQGTFIWQVEAVKNNQDGTIEQRGKIGENTFIVDIYLPGQIEAEDTGILYGR